MSCKPSIHLYSNFDTIFCCNEWPTSQGVVDMTVADLALTLVVLLIEETKAAAGGKVSQGELIPEWALDFCGN